MPQRSQSQYYRQRFAIVAAKFRYITMGSFRFTDMPREIQLQVVGYLNFTNLARTSKANRHMRDLPSIEMRRAVCEELERDFREIGVETQSYRILKEHRWVDVDGAFIRKGYRRNDCRKLKFMAPCFSCYNALSWGCIVEGKDVHKEPDCLWWYIEDNCESRKSSNTRICMACKLERTDLRKEEGKQRWVFTKTTKIVCCSKCERFEHTKNDICGRQWAAAMCDDCWRPEMERWNEYRRQVQMLRNVVDEYLTYMTKVERREAECDLLDNNPLATFMRIEDIKWAYEDGQDKKRGQVVSSSHSEEDQADKAMKK